MTIMPLVLVLLLSAILIVLLCTGDPKRRRSAKLPGAGQSTTTRRLLGAGACLPGVALAVSGNAAAFLIWMGGCGVIGWLIALWFARPAEKAHPPR